MHDCALFDIDGVLVDIRKSYNAAIKKTVAFMIREFSGKTYRNLVTDQIILKFRQTGGFNNDTDTSYAITLAMLANPQKNTMDGRRFLAKVAENADESGIGSVEKYLASFGAEKWKRKLAYPAPVRDSVLARVFDELFYGPELFEKQNNLEPKYSRGGRPLIRNDRLVVSRQTMKRLDTTFSGKLAIVSGRSRLAADHSLGPIMKYFDPVASVFLEDEKREYAKPNTFAIKHAMEALNAKTAVYAGDSAEDLLMARRAEKELGVRIDFVGIYGYSAEPKKIAAGFRKEGVVAIANVNQLTRTLKARL